MTRDFLLDMLERAIKTFAQAVLATLGAGALNVLHADWGNALALGAGAAVLSVLTSLLSIKLGGNGTASMTDAVVTTSYADAVAQARHAAGLADGPRD
ncbi:MAG: Holin [Nonomuraea sp.]|nr:Holin [Nonomuraea sp.]NUR27327.1 Holin [Catenulispora sp.]NUR71111.1 Holin [Hamadaea sp.]